MLDDVLLIMHVCPLPLQGLTKYYMSQIHASLV